MNLIVISSSTFIHRFAAGALIAGLALSVDFAAAQPCDTLFAPVGGTYYGPGVACDEVQCEPIEPTCPGDLNTDGVVSVSDLLLLLSNGGVCP